MDLVKTAGSLVTAAPYIDKLVSYIFKTIEGDKKERKAAEKLFGEAIEEIYANIENLENLKYDTVKTYAVNSPHIKKIINSLKTAKTRQCKEYAKNITQLKKKDSRKFFDKLSIALHKINAMVDYSNMETSEFEYRKRPRPAVRLENIRKTYSQIIEIIK